MRKATLMSKAMIRGRKKLRDVLSFDCSPKACAENTVVATLKKPKSQYILLKKITPSATAAIYIALSMCPIIDVFAAPNRGWVTVEIINGIVTFK